MVLSDEIQLGFALEAFGWAHKLGNGWAISKLACLRTAGISSMNELQTGCKEHTVNLDLELFGVPVEEQFSEKTLLALRAFLPGPVGFRAFRLAQMAAQKVRKGTAETEYVHRHESGKRGDETFHLPVGDNWILNVDCAGFVRNCLKHVTKDKLVMALSDRDFMRAKDFFRFFDAIPYTVMDPEEIPESYPHLRWRRVDDLRMVIPGDVICYRPSGNSAGAAAFTTNDRKDIKRLLKAVRTAQIWRQQENGEWKGFVTRNISKDPSVRAWVDAVKIKLSAVGIHTVKELYYQLHKINDILREQNYTGFYKDTIELMKECAETTAQNTGHIVFAAGLAVDTGNNEYRIRVVHSTKYGYKDLKTGEITNGVQEYYRRFKLLEFPDGTFKWTRAMKQAKPLVEVGDYGVSEDEDNPLDDMEDDEDSPNVDEEEVPDPEQLDELAGQGDVDVIAARMCF